MWVVEIYLVFERGAKITCFQCEHANWISFSVSGPNWLDFSVRDRTWLDSSVAWNGFGCCVGGRKLINFSVVDRHWFGFGVAVENDLLLASGSKLNGILCRGIEIDLILEWGSKLTWFQRWSRNSRFYVRDRNWLGFSVGIELDLVFVRGLKSTSVLCVGRKLLGFIVWIEINFVFV